MKTGGITVRSTLVKTCIKRIYERYSDHPGRNYCPKFIEQPRIEVLEIAELQQIVDTADTGRLPEAIEAAVVVPAVAQHPPPTAVPANEKQIDKGRKVKMPEQRICDQSPTFAATIAGESRSGEASRSKKRLKFSHGQNIKSNRLPDLFPHISRWSMSELLSSKSPQEIEPIALEYNSIQPYTQILRKWLLEETRAHVQKNLQSISAMRFQLVRIACCPGFTKPDENHRQVTCRSISENMQPGSGEDRCVMAASDIVFVSSLPPQISPEDLEKKGEFWSLGIVHGRPVSESSYDVVIRKGPLYSKVLLQEDILWYVVKLVPLVTFQRIWDNLHEPQTTPMMRLVATYKRRESPLNQRSTAPPNTPPLDKTLEFKLQTYCNTVHNLNASQSEAVKTFIHKQLDKKMEASVDLIQGPPGTGKTSTLIGMLSPSVCTSTRIVVCAPTNTAAHEAARRYLHQKQQADEGAHHYCGPSAAPCSPTRLGDVVLLGSEERRLVEKGSPLGGIFLPFRVRRLVDALDPYKGWESGCKAVLEVYGDPLKVQEICKQIITHGESLCLDLPTPHLSLDRMQEIETILASVQRILSLLTPSSSFEVTREVTRELHKLLRARTTTPFIPRTESAVREWVEETCVANANLVFSTVSAAAHKNMKLGSRFSCQTVIVDEAAQLVEAESAIVLQMQQVKQLVLIGDHKQLRATVKSQLAQDNAYARSMFERLQILGHPCRLLNVQYRMHPQISYFPRTHIYDRQVVDGDNVGLQERAYQRRFGPYAFVDVDGGVEKTVDGFSKRNTVEADKAIHLIGLVYGSVCADQFGTCQSFRKPVTVGVLSPYTGQVNYMKEQLRKGPIFNRSILDVEVNSIDGFQGRETDIVIFSAVRAKKNGNIGFLAEERRVNVALTRSRHALWIMGRAETLLRSKSDLWIELIEDAMSAGLKFDITEFLEK